MIIGYVPLLGSFGALMLAGENGAARLVTFLLVVVMSDTGGYVAGRAVRPAPMAPKISPKKSWEGFAGSVLFGTVGRRADDDLRLVVVLGRTRSSASPWSWSAPPATSSSR